MSKKQFDHIEDRIREAAANSEPAFDEQAWAAMDIRLNEEEKRRRFVFWWFAIPVLLIGGAVILFFSNKPDAENHLAAKNAKSITRADKKETGVKINEQPSALANEGDVIKNSTPPRKDEMKPNRQNENGIKETSVVKKPFSPIGQVKTYGTKKNFSKPTIAEQANETSLDLTKKTKKITGSKKKKIVSQVSGGAIGEEDDVAIKEQPPVVISTTAPNVISKQNTKPVFEKNSAKLKDSLKNSITKTETGNKPKEKAITPSVSRFYFLASAGGEIGSVKLLAFKNNPVTVKFGAGIGYQLSKNVSVQTGFYAGTKKYLAGPGDYKAKAGSYWNMVQIVKINAACLVYDIPVTMRYNILQKIGVTYFATAGLSSYIMKREDYDYYYIRNNMPHEGAYSYTGNKSAFSVLNFSAGIEKKLSSSFSLQLEPTMSVPLSGVGDGHVKLFNAALQFGIKYQRLKKH
jgi:hypothetical protein